MDPILIISIAAFVAAAAGGAFLYSWIRDRQNNKAEERLQVLAGMKPGDAEMLEDLILAAFRDARSKVEVAMQEKMQEVAGGLPLPPGMKLF